MSTTDIDTEFHQTLQTHRPLLWSICYRLTGCNADTEDLIQETFAKAIEQPPQDTTRSLRPWLVKVATNLGKDLLRRRKHQGYIGPWLPSPIDQEETLELPDPAPNQECRYSLRESATFAFLLALESLSPQQRAVLILRDVFDYSVKETAELLEMSEANIKTTHHRARSVIHHYDEKRCVPTPLLQQKTQHALEQFLTSLFNQDRSSLEQLLAEDVKLLSDSNGKYTAAGVPVYGREKVAKFYLNISRNQREILFMEIRLLNGLPALVVELVPKKERDAPQYIIRCDIDEHGRITALHSIMAERKIQHLTFGDNRSHTDLPTKSPQ